MDQRKKGLTLETQFSKGKRQSIPAVVRDLILAKFSLEPDDVRSTSMGAGGEDILLSPLARRRVPLSIECKSREKIAVYGYYEQAEENSKGRGEPCVFIKQNRSKPW
jgi:hypothetical protein